MPIDVICPGCHGRFKVSEKFAGKKGPCPKCKHEITIPEAQEDVVVHAPEDAGPKDKEGRSISKPIARKETTVSTTMWVLIGASILTTVVVALLFRGKEIGWPVLALGAVFLAPPLILGGYSFLRDDELEPYRGQSLWLRILAVTVVYALTWAFIAYVPSFVFELDSLETFHLLLLLPVVAAIGAFAASLALEMDITFAAIHYGMYLLATVLLRVLMGLPIIPLFGAAGG